jgi:hypothetical protein
MIPVLFHCAVTTGLKSSPVWVLLLGRYEPWIYRYCDSAGASMLVLLTKAQRQPAKRYSAWQHLYRIYITASTFRVIMLNVVYECRVFLTVMLNIKHWVPQAPIPAPFTAPTVVIFKEKGLNEEGAVKQQFIHLLKFFCHFILFRCYIVYFEI